MCHVSCVIFGASNLSKEEIQGKRVIELGSYDVNGSLRTYVKSLNPSEYIGVDIKKGPGVDIVCDAENIVDKFGKEAFDVVISTELLEHVRNWRKVISNIKNICKLNGLILITTRSIGFPYHGYPYDFWRYEVEDMKQICSDLEILVLKKDPEVPGVFIKAKKPSKFNEKDLSEIRLYSIILNKRVAEINDRELQHVPMRVVFNIEIKRLRQTFSGIVRRIYSKITGL